MKNAETIILRNISREPQRLRAKHGAAKVELAAEDTIEVDSSIAKGLLRGYKGMFEEVKAVAAGKELEKDDHRGKLNLLKSFLLNFKLGKEAEAEVEKLKEDEEKAIEKSVADAKKKRDEGEKARVQRLEKDEKNKEAAEAKKQAIKENLNTAARLGMAMQKVADFEKMTIAKIEAMTKKMVDDKRKEMMKTAEARAKGVDTKVSTGAE